MYYLHIELHRFFFITYKCTQMIYCSNTKLVFLWQSCKMSTRREIDVVIAIQLGINHTSNAWMIKHECKDFNVPFDIESQSITCKSVTTPTVALFDDKGAIRSYGFEAELQHMQLDNASNHILFREFIWDLFCSDDTVG